MSDQEGEITTKHLKVNFGDQGTLKNVFTVFYGTLCDFSERYLKNREEAEENVARIFTDLWNKKQVFTDQHHLRTYLYRAAFNGSLNVLRSRKRREQTETEYWLNTDSLEESFLNNMLRSEVVAILYREIYKLPEHYALILKMAYIDGLKNEEIVELSGYSSQTVKNYKVKGLALLRSKLSAEQWILLTSFIILHI